MPELRHSASEGDLSKLRSESSSPTGPEAVDMFRREATKGKGKLPGKQRMEHGDNVASLSTTGQEEFDLLRQTTKEKHLKNHPVEHGDNVASSSTTGQEEFDLLEALQADEEKRWGDQGTESREPDSRIEIEMHRMARLSPDRGRSYSRYHTERRPRDLEEGLGPHEGNEEHHTDTDRSRSMSSERREFTEREIRSQLRRLEDGMRYIRQRLDDMQRSDNTNRPDNTGNNTGRRTWGEWYDGRWNSHISTLGGVVAPLSVVGTVYLLRPDLLTKAVNALGHR